MRPIAHTEWRGVTPVSPAKRMNQFGVWSRVGPRNHVLDGVHIPLWGEGALRADRPTVWHCKVRQTNMIWGWCKRVSSAKTTEPISMPREEQPNDHVYDTIRYDTRCYFNVRSKADISQLNLPHVLYGCTWRIRRIDLCNDVDAVYRYHYSNNIYKHFY